MTSKQKLNNQQASGLKAGKDKEIYEVIIHQTNRACWPKAHENVVRKQINN